MTVDANDTRRIVVMAGHVAAFVVLAVLALPCALRAQDPPDLPPSAEALAEAVGRASRAEPIAWISRDLNCGQSPSSTLDSASIAACAALDAPAAAVVVEAFLRGLGRPRTEIRLDDPAATLPLCLDHGASGPRPPYLASRISAPVIGQREGKWEGRITVELRCRDPEAARQATQVTAKEFLFQWDGRAWKLYQVGARRTRT